MSIAAQDPQREAGFTVMELAVSIAIGAFIFTTLAMVLGGSLKTLSVQKARTQGNEVATLGMEDLQRLTFDRLHLCPGTAPRAGAPSYTPTPTGFTELVVAPNCNAPAKYSPCNPAVNGDVPMEVYTCKRGATTFDVRRYVAWGDIARTEKRLAVHVTWRDGAGLHEVAQQSSLRIPGQGALLGASPPEVTAVDVTPNTIKVEDGLNGNTIRIAAITSGLRSVDSVFAVFNILEGGMPRSQEVQLANPSGDGVQWEGFIPEGSLPFGQGSQFFVVTAIRKADGKTNSRVSEARRFCPTDDPGSCPSTLARVSGASVTPTAADTDGAGALLGELVVTANTSNVSPADSVVVVFQTTGGAASAVLSPDTLNFPCDATSCNATWTGRISSSAGYRFNTGSQYFYFTAFQGTDTGYVVDNGSTAAARSGQQVTFG